MTAREAWNDFVLREHRAQGKAESTLADHRTHLRRWEEFCANTRTVNPSVAEITRNDLRDWRDWLTRELAGLTGPPGPFTPEERAAVEATSRNVNKHLNTLQQVLKACVDEGMIQSCPRLKPLVATTAGDKVSLKSEEVSAVYLACDCVTWPERSARCVLQWRTAIVLLWMYGFRTQELISYERDHEPLRWLSVLFQAACPGNQGRESWDAGWLSYVPQKQRRKKPLPVIVPLHPEARRHLEACRADAQDDSAVFAWPLSSHGFREQWAAVVQAAAGRSGHSIAECTPSQFRKTAHTHHKQIGGRELAELITGHAPRSVSERHYDVPYGDLVKHFAKVTVPEAFASPLPVATGPKQLTLW